RRREPEGQPRRRARSRGGRGPRRAPALSGGEGGACGPCHQERRLARGPRARGGRASAAARAGSGGGPVRQRAIATRSGSPTGARAARSRGPRAARRRRRLAYLFVGVLAAAAIGVTVLGPIVHDAILEITLPLRHEDIIRQQAREKN